MYVIQRQYRSCKILHTKLQHRRLLSFNTVLKKEALYVAIFYAVEGQIYNVIQRQYSYGIFKERSGVGEADVQGPVFTPSQPATSAAARGGSELEAISGQAAPPGLPRHE